MLGIIGGTGLYKIEELENPQKVKVETPFGSPSAPIVKAGYQNNELFFLPRHGENHQLFPEEINYRANIWALKSLGVKKVLSVSAVGSLKEELSPGSLFIPTQYFDFIKGDRRKTFFGQGLIAHISTAIPVCPEWSSYLFNIGKQLGLQVHFGGTYSCVDGPRLGTKAESFFLKDAVNSSVVGMSNIPEVFLAREAQMLYCSLCIITDYDCWKEEESEIASTESIFARYAQSLGDVKLFIKKLLSEELPEDNEIYRKSLEGGAVLTPENLMNETQKKILKVLKL